MKRTLLFSAIIGSFSLFQAQLTSINENFDLFAVTTPGFPQNGWTTKPPNSSMVLVNEEGTNKFVQSYASTQTNVPHYLISPQIVAPNGTKTLSFEASKFTQSGFMGTIEAGLVSNPNDMATFASLGSAVMLQTTTPQTFTYAVPASSSQYIAFKFIGLNNHASTKLDNISYGTSGNVCNNTDPGNTAGDTGCVTFNYKGQLVTYTTVRGADGKVWLQQNLGSSQVATSMADADSYGDLFQWGRWDDGHQLRNSPTTTVPSTNNPAGLNGISSFILGTSPSWWSTNASSDLWNGANTMAITSEIGVDPCKAIGAGWKLPSQADWVAAVNAEGMGSAATAYSSKLKLPAAGYRSQSSGGFTYVGERGYYWSGDIAVSGGRYLYNSTTLANPNSGGPRAQGQSVRCLKSVTGLSTTDIRKVNIGVYPNPTNGILNIKTHSDVENVTITNVVGQKINIEIKNNQINMSELPNGVYIVELILKDGKKISKKIIKN